MSEENFEPLQEWPEDGLESVDLCPVCGSSNVKIIYQNLRDRLFGAPGMWTMYICEDCKSGYLNPRPNSASIKLAYSDYETHNSPASNNSPINARLSTKIRNSYLNFKYGYRLNPSVRFGFVAMYFLPPPLRYEWDYFARHLPKVSPGENKLLLDVGCGNGEFLLRAKSQGWHVKGIDFDEEATKKAAEAGIDVIHGTIDPERFPKHHFDYITCNQVIEHVHDPHLLLKSMHRWLKPGGKLWLGTPNFDSNLRKEIGEHWFPLQPPTHLNIFSKTALISLMKSSGFSNVKIIPRGYNEVHYHRTSTHIKNSDNFSVREIIKNRDEVLPIISRTLIEFLCWMFPGRGSDIVVIANANEAGT